MTGHPQPSLTLKRRVLFLFFIGLLIMAAVAIAVGWAFTDWGKFTLGWPNPVLGFAFTFGGISLVVWSVRVQYTLGQGTPAPKVATQRLVTQGPYAYTRNPMTLGAMLIYQGIGIWLGSGVVIILTLVVFSTLLTYIYVHETRELAQRFGAPYLEYRNRTLFLFPRFWRLR